MLPYFTILIIMKSDAPFSQRKQKSSSSSPRQQTLNASWAIRPPPPLASPLPLSTHVTQQTRAAWASSPLSLLDSLMSSIMTSLPEPHPRTHSDDLHLPLTDRYLIIAQEPSPVLSSLSPDELSIARTQLLGPWYHPRQQMLSTLTLDLYIEVINASFSASTFKHSFLAPLCFG